VFPSSITVNSQQCRKKDTKEHPSSEKRRIKKRNWAWEGGGEAPTGLKGGIEEGTGAGLGDRKTKGGTGHIG